MSSLTHRLNRDSFVTYKKLVVQPGDQVKIYVTGQTLVCIEANHGFQLRLDEGEFFPWNLGLKLKLLPTDFFASFTVRNTDADEPLVAEFLILRGDVDDQRLNVVRERGMPYKTVQTKILTHPETQLNYQQEVYCKGLADPGSGLTYRKEILITNLDPLNDIEVLLADTRASIGFVLARTAWCLETSEDLIITNPNASPIACRISEIFYADE